jgi:DNA repair exonuclease SbcCD ATPase subunit
MPSIAREGLPYWVFWLMLCFILLLVAFIFLRDKRLRMRLSAFLAGARRRSVLLQIKYKLKKERQIRAGALKKIGERAWGEDIRVPGSESVFAQLKNRLVERNAAQKEWQDTLAETEKEHARRDELAHLYRKKRDVEAALMKPFDDLLKRKREEEKALKRLKQDGELARQLDDIERDREETRKRIRRHRDAIKAIETEGAAQRREVEKEIRSLSSRKERIQDRIKAVEAEQQEHYLSLGRLLEENRSDSPALAPFYRELDEVNGRIEILHHRIETLTGGERALLPPGLR